MRFQRNQRQIFSIRKFKAYGAASVMLGLLTVGQHTVHAIEKVANDNTALTPMAVTQPPQETKVSEVLKESSNGVSNDVLKEASKETSKEALQTVLPNVQSVSSPTELKTEEKHHLIFLNQR